MAIGKRIKCQIPVNTLLEIADKEGDANEYVEFSLADKHDAVLTFDNVTSREYAYALYDGDTMIIPENYQVTEQASGLTVAVNPAYIPTLTPGGTLKFVYFMHLNEKVDSTKGFKDEANVNNGHIDNQTSSTAEVATNGKRFIKVDGGVTATQALAGVSFVARDQNSDTVSYLRIDEATKAATWVKTKAEVTAFATTADELVDTTKPEYGAYYLEETVAPGDYALLTSRIEFVVSEQSCGTAENLVSPEKIPSKHKGTLPSTGGKGVYAYLGSGAVLLLIAGVYFARRRKENA